MIPLIEFDAAFRKLCAAFGVQYSAPRVSVYYENIGKIFKNLDEWERVVQRLIRTETAFPKIATIMAMRKSEESTMSRDEETLRWVQSDCSVRECVEGVISIEREGMSFAYRCPRCERSNAYIPVYRGDVTLHDPETMKRRRDERMDIVYRPEVAKENAKKIIKMIRDCLGDKEGT